ncbi:MAG: hypothetical protein DWQ35_13725 [Planctomycetota bacterium]|nr:MAG: hypothetical protein DWQ35_13725 [Planctomycetota bacterium]REK25997.1 MAG: hypothetical protein DWQ42_10235 [Planctomycetota bacterium]REK46888.1 MAG: hypothetical protein DWQ46_05170 [Planctomycetota bacterium]
MENPFEKRATEHLRDDVAFLAVVTPEPVSRFLKPAAEAGYLYDRLVVISGSPGSGKTTLGRLFEYPSLNTLVRLSDNSEFRDLNVSMTGCRAIQGSIPKLLGCRLQLESDYRNFWECPYPEKLKTGMMTSLLQARALLSWLRNLTLAGISLDRVTIVPRKESEAVVDAIGGVQAAEIQSRAREVEAALYGVVGALVPPPIDQIEDDATSAYQPFDVIEAFLIQRESSTPLELRPLVIFDDAHELHRDQYQLLTRWLARRELRISRWMLTRFDVLTPTEALDVASSEPIEQKTYAGITAGRDLVYIVLQSSGASRASQRRSFRKMAKDMANRYLRRMPFFSELGLTNLSSILGSELAPASNSTLKKMKESADKTQDRLKIKRERRGTLETSVDEYLKGVADRRGLTPEFTDVKYAMLNILMHRYAKRTKGPTLFGDDDPDPSRPLKVDASVFDSACLHLLHSVNRPYYFGIDRLCDAGSENAELFLHLTGTLVERSATQVIQGKNAVLSPATQNHLLRERASDIIERWNFPSYMEVRRLLHEIGTLCRDISMEPNAWLAPNAYGVSQEEFESIASSHPRLAFVLQFAVAYNAIHLNPNHSCKGQRWCVIELGGTPSLRYGLTLNRGGFVEGGLAQLTRFLEGAE